MEDKNVMLLKYQNLTIRNATIDDAEQLAIWWNDGTVMAYVGFPNGTGQTAKEIAAILKYDSEHTCRHLIIEVDHLPAGEMNYRIKDKDTVEIGIKICDLSLCNKGLGKKLLSMLIASLFSDMGYKRITLDTNADNKRAQHVYEKLGFRKLQVHENSWKDQLGKLKSSIDYEMYREDFVNFAK